MCTDDVNLQLVPSSVMRPPALALLQQLHADKLAQDGGGSAQAGAAAALAAEEEAWASERFDLFVLLEQKQGQLHKVQVPDEEPEFPDEDL